MSDINDLFQLVGAMDEKLDRVLEQHEDQEARIRSLEKSRNWFLGAAAGTGAFAAFLWNTFFGSKN